MAQTIGTGRSLKWFGEEFKINEAKLPARWLEDFRRWRMIEVDEGWMEDDRWGVDR